MNAFFLSLILFAATAVETEQPCVLEVGYRPSGNKAEVAQKSEAKSETEAKAEVAQKAETEVKTESAQKSGVRSEAVKKAKPKAKPKTGAKVQPKGATDAKPSAKPLTGRPAKITSDSTVYNRKEGIASFEGHVHVDDEQYQMHADRVFLFLEGTNELKRVVAIGHVAMTNEMRRAYGTKVTYSKKNGLVVLYGGDGIDAEVRDESKTQDQVVRGSRIRFWIGSEQVEVDEAALTGPAPGVGADTLKKAIGR